MNAYLKHFLQCRLKMFESIQQIDRVVRRVRHVENFGDYNDAVGNLPLTTHLKDFRGTCSKGI